jgi:tetratricopeptide (TPR) repeat protein
MTRRFFSPLLVVFLSVAILAQGHPGGGGGHSGGGAPSPGNTPSPGLNLPSRLPEPGSSMPRPMFLSGKVVVEDGTPLTDSAVIQTICRGVVRNEAYTDSKGAFSIDLSNSAMRPMTGAADDMSSSRSAMDGTGTNNNNPLAVRDLRDCDLQAVLPGFTSQVVELASKMTDFGTADVGRVVLHRVGHVQGFTISATSAMAPGKAKKLYERGLEDEKKNKLDAAEEDLSKAVQVYPKYAVAWNELGRVQLAQKKSSAAKNSFQQSIAADRTYLGPYEELSQLAMQEKQWKILSDTTDEMLRLNSVNFPQYWFYNSVANYFLQSLDKAEKSALEGIKVDEKHRIPKLEYLLGMILVQKHDYPNALLHVRNYIRLAPNASDLQTAQQQIAELEKLTGSAPQAKN